MFPIMLDMTYKKSTKGTHVYEKPGSAIPSLYIKRDALDKEPPGILKIIISDTYETIKTTV